MRANVLDHGYVECVESWGSDEGVIAAARMSTGKGFLGWGPVSKCVTCGDLFDGPERPCPRPSGTREYADCGRGGHRFEDAPGDEKLLRYLWTRRHTTPFETPGMTVEVAAPVVVVWQWVRHRTMTFNVLSGRYAPMPDDDYLPAAERCLGAGGGNRQAGRADGAPALTADNAHWWLGELRDLHHAADSIYRKGLAVGVPKEVARLALTFSRYTRMRVTANLLNWTRFLALRNAPDAQAEIRLYAVAVQAMLAGRFPRTLALFAEGRPS